jgi:N-acetylglucosaminyldiphosphoundecaprenol N-acetyl-beta-D-mannosaminyltransferase
MIPPRRVNILGVGLSEIDYATALTQITAAIAERRRGYVTVTGVHGVMECQADPALLTIHNKSLLSTPDGMPMSWMGWMAGSRVMDRVYGPDLMLQTLEAGVAHGWRHFLYGGRDGVAEVLRDSLVARFPGLQIVGTFTPPFRPLTPDEDVALAAQVTEARPDCLWVGLSTPKQERFMAAYLPRLETTLMFGVGAAFDFHAGLVSQAPAPLQRLGLEWLYRLCMEPKRLWRRYTSIVPRFLLLAAAQLTGLRRYTAPETPGATIIEPKL